MQASELAAWARCPLGSAPQPFQSLLSSCTLPPPGLTLANWLPPVWQAACLRTSALPPSVCRPCHVYPELPLPHLPPGTLRLGGCFPRPALLQAPSSLLNGSSLILSSQRAAQSSRGGLRSQQGRPLLTTSAQGARSWAPPNPASGLPSLRPAAWPSGPLERLDPLLRARFLTPQPRLVRQVLLHAGAGEGAGWQDGRAQVRRTGEAVPRGFQEAVTES